MFLKKAIILNSYVKENNLSIFFPYLLLNIVKRFENNLKIENISLNQEEKEIINILWRLDFYQKKSYEVYYKLLNSFSNELTSVSKKGLGLITDVIIELPNQQYNLKFFLIATMINTYLKLNDSFTANQLLKNIENPYIKKHWKVFFLCANFEIAKLKNDINNLLDTIENILDIFESRKYEFIVLQYNINYFYWYKAISYFKKDFPLKGLTFLKKINNFSELKETKEKVKTLFEIIRKFESTGNFQIAFDMYKYLLNIKLHNNEMPSYLIKINNKLIRLSKKYKEENILTLINYVSDKIQKEYPHSNKAKKISNKIIKKIDIEKNKKNYSIYIWPFFISIWIILLISFFIPINFLTGLLLLIIFFYISILILKKYKKFN